MRTAIELPVVQPRGFFKLAEYSRSMAVGQKGKRI